jgi:hypothetical protein
MKKARHPFKAGAEDIGSWTSEEHPQPTDNKDIQDGLEMASYLFGALSAGLSALGPKGAGPAGVVSMLASLFGSEEDQPPSPPNSQEIDRIVEKVVDRELKQLEAKQAATAFAMATDNFISYAKTALDDAKLKIQSGNPHGGEWSHEMLNGESELRDFVNETVRINRGTGSFNYSIYHLAGNPEIAKWILPVYCSAIVVWLMLKRLYILMRTMPDDLSSPPQPTIADAESYRHDVEEQRKALENTYKAYEAYREGRIVKTGLQSTLKRAEMEKLVTMWMYGTASIEVINQMIEDLKGIEKKLQTDISNRKLDYFWPQQEEKNHNSSARPRGPDQQENPNTNR